MKKILRTAISCFVVVIALMVLSFPRSASAAGPNVLTNTDKFVSLSVEGVEQCGHDFVSE